MAPAYGRFGHFTLLDELLVFRAALDEFERALLFDDLRGITRKVPAIAHRLHEARALHAPTEFSDSRKCGLIPAFVHFRVDTHVAGV